MCTNSTCNSKKIAIGKLERAFSLGYQSFPQYIEKLNEGKFDANPSNTKAYHEFQEMLEGERESDIGAYDE